MPDAFSPEDEAALYVIGALNATERREFEARLVQSAPLRALVQELEEGAMALAKASPAKQPPELIWQRVKKTIAEDTNRKMIIANWWRSGWAAAAACMAGWFLYALWMNQPAPSVGTKAPVDFAAQPQPSSTPAETLHAKTGHASRSTQAEIDTANRLLQTKAQEIAGLHWRVAELEKRLNALSQSLVEQQSLLNEPARLKFFHLATENGNTTTATLSPELQRAIFLAMARELGWLQSTNTSAGDSAHSEAANQLNIDFVDLRPGRNNVPSRGRSQSEMEKQAATVPDPTVPATTATGTLPAFVSGDKLIVAIDPTIAASGSQLVFLTDTTNQGQQSLGTAVMGDNPLIVTLPMSSFSANGWNLTVTTGTSSGISNVIHFSPQEISNP